jgi:hypothetical protein
MEQPVRRRRVFGIIWLVWIAGFASAFIMFETAAIRNPAAGDTLSEQVWWLLQYPVFAVPFTIVWFGGLAWLSAHFFRKYRP